MRVSCFGGVLVTPNGRPQALGSLGDGSDDVLLPAIGSHVQRNPLLSVTAFTFR